MEGNETIEPNENLIVNHQSNPKQGNIPKHMLVVL
jgi:hypothetical protein